MAIVIRNRKKLTKRKILRQRLILYYLKLQNICAKTGVTKNMRSQCHVGKTLNVLRKIANLKLYSKITYFKRIKPWKVRSWNWWCRRQQLPSPSSTKINSLSSFCHFHCKVIRDFQIHHFVNINNVPNLLKVRRLKKMRGQEVLNRNFCSCF